MKHDSSREARCKVLDQSSNVTNKKVVQQSIPIQQESRGTELTRMLELDSEGHETFRSPRNGKRPKSRGTKHTDKPEKVSSSHSNIPRDTRYPATSSSVMQTKDERQLSIRDNRINKSSLAAHNSVTNLMQDTSERLRSVSHRSANLANRLSEESKAASNIAHTDRSIH